MPTIMIIEDTSFWQKQVGQAVRGAGYPTVIANDGAEAIALLNTHTPALIISDIEMPRMTGLQFMEAIRGMPRWQKTPIIMLTTDTAKDHILKAIRLHAAHYMLKGTFSPEELVERIKKHLIPTKSTTEPAAAKKSANAFPQLLQRSEVIERILELASGGKTLAGVPKLLKEFCEAVPNVPATLLEVVKHDPIVAMRVMQRANDSKRVGTLEEAVRTVGVEAIQEITKSLQAYPEKSGPAIAMWQHSIAVACVMQKIVPRSFEMSPGVAYVIGLLHDLPEILLRQAFPSQYGVAADFADQAGRPLRHIMREVFGVSISEITSELMTVLKLPPLIGMSLREYAVLTESERGGGSPSADRLALALQFSEYFANALQMMSTSADAMLAPLSLTECRTAYVSTDPVNGADIRARAMAMTKKLSGDASETTEEKPARLKIWYTRHKSFAPFDPIEEALKLFGDVQTHTEPPTKREHFQDLDGVVVCAESIENFGVLWCLPDRVHSSSAAGPLKILYLLPPAGANEAKRSAHEDLSVLAYPLSMARLKGLSLLNRKSNTSSNEA
jgi:two-component system chemotaxis response regulator CheY